jgi:BirA family biotin operon repressor/biotin-[acetyl-CoA-carboxylase] ligase
MNEAARLARANAPSGSIVAALEQTAGQGRHGHSWLSTKGDGLYCTFLYRLAAQAADVSCLTLAFGLATSEALSHLTGEHFDIRWPNDILFNGRKCCGILARLEGEAVLAGIGINLMQESFPDGLRTPAVSLRQITGRTFHPQETLEALIPVMDAYVQLFTSEGREPVLRLFGQASSYVQGRRVQVDLDDRTIRGITCGLDAYGFLRVETESGQRETIVSGSVRPWE